ncbi:hypothetical protein KQI84_01085 [bacterium]|nr:hypothetical protein [bacterium]
MLTMAVDESILEFAEFRFAQQPGPPSPAGKQAIIIPDYGSVLPCGEENGDLPKRLPFPVLPVSCPEDLTGRFSSVDNDRWGHGKTLDEG